MVRLASMPQADLQEFPSRGVLELRETLLCGSGPDPLSCCLAVLPALKTRTFQKAKINVGCGTNPMCPCFSLAQGEGELPAGNRLWQRARFH